MRTGQGNKRRTTPGKIDGIVVFVTASSEAEASTIGHKLVEMQLAACANILPHIRSIFRWKEKIVEEPEVLLLLKTRSELFDDLAEAVRRLHSYEVPEVIALPIKNGSVNYLGWILANTRRPMK